VYQAYIELSIGQMTKESELTVIVFSSSGVPRFIVFFFQLHGKKGRRASAAWLTIYSRLYERA
jgi:hypothetical protein